MKYLENIEAQMRKGTLELAILSIISKKEVYSSEIIEMLSGTDLIVVEGTLYPILSRLRKSELLDYSWKESTSGPPRKYFKLTDKGSEALKKLKKSWSGLNKSINSIIKKNGKSS